jgi:Txe/YoeB family toxin of Txe-Axe toxin-antitoxin module
VKNPATNQDYVGNLVFDYCTSFSNGHYARYTNNLGRDDKVAGKTVGDPNAVEDWNENGELVGIKFTQTSDKVCDDVSAPPDTTFRLVTKVRCDKTKVVAIRSLDWTGKTLDNFCTMEVETTHSSGCVATNTNPVTRYAGPNGSPYDNSGLFTQKQRYNDFQAWLDADAQMQLGINNIVRDSKKYDNWEKMHNGVIWYDTAGCWGKHIGAANSV